MHEMHMICTCHKYRKHMTFTCIMYHNSMTFISTIYIYECCYTFVISWMRTQRGHIGSNGASRSHYQNVDYTWKEQRET